MAVSCILASRTERCCVFRIYDLLVTRSVDLCFIVFSKTYATLHLRSSVEVGLLLLFLYSDYLLFIIRFVLLATVSVSMCRLSVPFCVFEKWADALMFGCVTRVILDYSDTG